jgi:hypothetical protein
MGLVLTLGDKATALGPSADEGEDGKCTLGPLVVHSAQEQYQEDGLSLTTPYWHCSMVMVGNSQGILCALPCLR